MISYITYLFGAGASANAIPVVNGLPDGLRKHREKILEYQDATQSTVNAYLQNLDEVIKAAENHASIDTYAKKLYLENSEKLNILKSVLSVYFLCEQATENFDKRYDTFWASILNEASVFPENIKIVSWNYDMQFEHAYKTYHQPDRLQTINRYSDERSWRNTFFILKLNGTAEFICDRGSRLGKKNTPALKRPYHYKSINTLLNGAMIAYGEAIGHNACVPGISFAWESINRTDLLEDPFLENVETHLSITNVLIVIGYSFPYFNREVDRRLLKAMGKVEKIYIQDKNPDDVRERLEAVLPAGRNIEIVLRTSVDQFYLPNEL